MPSVFAPGDPVPVPAGREYVPQNCDCGKCANSIAPPVIEPSCGCQPSCGTGIATCAPCNGCYDPCCSCGGCGVVLRDTLQELLPCDKCGCSCCTCGGPWRLFPTFGDEGGIQLYGWLNGGGTAGSHNTRHNGPIAFNDRNEMQLNQAYAVLERKIGNRSGWDLGGRVDFLYGTDYIFTQTTGLERQPNDAPRWNRHNQYGIANPQAYLEVGVNDISMKIGHFYTLLGYESVMAPQNFFRSHSYTMMYGEPFTHAGMLMSFKYSDDMMLHSGVVNGWDRLDGVTDKAAYLGGFNYSPAGAVYDLAFSFISGDEQNALGGQTARTLYSLVMNLQLTDNFSYVLQHDHGWQDDFFNPGQNAEWYGINQYLFYDVNDCWTLGGRFEWFRDDDGVRVTGVRPTNPYQGGSAGNFFQTSMGVNYRPTNNLVVRPEIRWDWFDGIGTLPFDGNRRASQFTGGFDVIWQW